MSEERNTKEVLEVVVVVVVVERIIAIGIFIIPTNIYNATIY